MNESNRPVTAGDIIVTKANGVVARSPMLLIVHSKIRYAVNMFAHAIPLLFILAPAIAAQRPPSPFEVTGCTMECCGYGTWRTKTRTIAFVQRDTASAKAFVIEPNDSVVALSGIVAMQQPGVATAPRNRAMRVNSYPKLGAERTIMVPAGDTIYTLFESAEATDAIIWYRGSLYWSVPDDGGPTQLPSLRARWWVSIRNRRGEVGWVRDPWSGFDGPGKCR
jgi:hypothetical protein